MEAIILAGGLGTRLKSEVQDTPKTMALINFRPFMEYLLDYLIQERVTKIIFSVGYMAEFIQDHFSDKYKDCPIVYAIEKTLLGTGGAIKNAMKEVTGKDVLIVNGDSIFISNIQAQINAHQKENADVTMALKRMKNIERYGTVKLNPRGKIISFNEKQPLEEGLVNTGVYIFNVNSFQALELPEKFSVETDFFEPYMDRMNFLGHCSDGYFLDIGVPKDFKRAQLEIGVFPKIDQSWTLFLDIDGVINKKGNDNNYVKTLDEQELLNVTIEAIIDLSKIFGRIIIVTNQQGIGKRLITEESLTQIHKFIIQKVEHGNGHIDAVYYAPELDSKNSNKRKPQIGIASQAKEDFEEIEFSKSIILGDTPSDMEFGKRVKMIPIMIAEGSVNHEFGYSFNSLSDFSEMLKSILQPTNPKLH